MRMTGLAGVAERYAAVCPPSTGKVTPVTSDDASEARNTAGPTNSSGSPNLPMGIFAVSRSITSGSSRIAEISGVFIWTGASALTRMLWGAHSIANSRVRAATPPLLAV